MNKLLIAIAAAGTIGIAAIAATTSAEASGFGRRGSGGSHHMGGGFHGGGMRFGGGHFNNSYRFSGHHGYRHYGSYNWGHNNWNHHNYSWRYPSYRYGSGYGYGRSFASTPVSYNNGGSGGNCWHYEPAQGGQRWVNSCRPNNM